MIQILAYGRRMGVRRVVSVFSEGVRHTGAAWTHAEHARNAILMAYNHVAVRFHEPKPCMNPTVIDGLEPERQGFFRDVWVLGNKRS